MIAGNRNGKYEPENNKGPQEHRRNHSFRHLTNVVRYKVSKCYSTRDTLELKMSPAEVDTFWWDVTYTHEFFLQCKSSQEVSHIKSADTLAPTGLRRHLLSQKQGTEKGSTTERTSPPSALCTEGSVAPGAPCSPYLGFPQRS